MFCLFPLELLFALLLPALLFFLMLRSALVELGMTFSGFLFCLDLWRGCHRRSGVGGCFGCGLWVMHRAVLVGANGQLGTETFAVDDDGCFGGVARHRGFSVRVVGHGLDLSDVSALYGSRSLLFWIALTVLDLDKAGMGGNLPVKEYLNLAVVAA